MFKWNINNLGPPYNLLILLILTIWSLYFETDKVMPSFVFSWLSFLTLVYGPSHLCTKHSFERVIFPTLWVSHAPCLDSKISNVLTYLGEFIRCVCRLGCIIIICIGRARNSIEWEKKVPSFDPMVEVLIFPLKLISTIHPLKP